MAIGGVEVIVPVIASFVTGLVTLAIARGNQRIGRDRFYEGKITALMEAQEKKITLLQEEVERLTNINLQLLEKVIHLETELARYDSKIIN